MPAAGEKKGLAFDIDKIQFKSLYHEYKLIVV